MEKVTSPGLQPPSRHRGKLLTALLLVYLLADVIGLIWGLILQKANVGQYPWGVFLIIKVLPIATAFLSIALMVGIWYWKRLSVYLYFISIISGFVVQILSLSVFIGSISSTPKTQFPLPYVSTVIGLIPSLLLLGAIKRKWQYFT